MPASSDQLEFRPIVHLEDAVPRSRLSERILKALPTTARLTLVLAPAGFGKTTALAQTAVRIAEEGEHVAWLNCGQHDRDPGVFVESICSAWICAGVTGIDPSMGITEMCRSLGQSTLRRAIFIDRFEQASSPAVDTLLANLTMMLPGNVRCVVGSRVVPEFSLASLQVEGHLRVVDVDALRFTEDEARTLLSSNLPEAGARIVIDRAAGWPFMLQLARLRMASSSSTEPVLSEVVASLPLHEIFDYLATQVLATLSPDDVQFLVEVAVLDSIDVASANAVRGRADSASHVERLKSIRPIVVVNAQPLGASLHPLLRDLLRNMLEREDEGGRASTLHTRAASHFAARGMLHEAVSHAVLGGRFELAARILCDAGGLRLLVGVGVGRVKVLLQLLPPAVIQKHPRVRLLRIMQLILEENGVGARLDFDRMATGLAELQAVEKLDQVTRDDLQLARAFLLANDAEHTFRFRIGNDLPLALSQGRKEAVEDSRYLLLALSIEILMLQRYGPLDRAERRAAEAQRLHEEGNFSYNMPWTWIYNARNAYARGDLGFAKQELLRASRRELEIFKFTHGSYGQLVHALLGKLCLDQGELDEAFQHFEAIAPVKPMTLFEIHAGIYVHYPLCEFARGNSARALKMLANARQIAFDENLPHLDILAAASEIQILIAISRHEEAGELARSSRIEHVLGIAKQVGELPAIVAEAVEAACFCIALANDTNALADDIAKDALTMAQRCERPLGEIDAQLMLARAGVARADAAASQEAVDRALDIAARCGVVQPFVSAGAEVLSIVRDASAAPKHPSSAWAAHIAAAADENLERRGYVGELFTQRERDVLRGLVKGQSTKMIARELLLSPETIKHHLKAVFSKLNVRSRDAAVDAVRRRAMF